MSHNSDKIILTTKNTKKKFWMYSLRVVILFVMTVAIYVMPIYAASPDLLFQAGNKAYLDGNYQKALSNWQSIEAMEYEGAELFYNMGNSHYKLSHVGLAILYWEKSLKISGEDEDLMVNLAIAETNLTDQIEKSVSLPVWGWIAEIRALFSDTLLSISAVILGMMIFGILSLRRWVVRGNIMRKFLKGTLSAMIVLIILNLTLIMLQVRDERATRQGIIIQSAAEIFSAPAVGTGTLLFTLHEGTKVSVLRGLEGWYEISFGSGKQGWVTSDKIGVI